jgi:uncharacterized membrane protein YsdA (DUF1294 family)
MKGLELVLIAYTAASALAFIANAIDKRRAIHGGRRISEASLHLLELLGGWPGALLAHSAFRHKTRAIAYRVVLWSIILLHGVAWAVWWQRFS